MDLTSLWPVCLNTVAHFKYGVIRIMSNHGGKRENAGRPRGQGKFGEPTVSVRVPQSQGATIKIFWMPTSAKKTAGVLIPVQNWPPITVEKWPGGNRAQDTTLLWISGPDWVGFCLLLIFSLTVIYCKLARFSSDEYFSFSRCCILIFAVTALCLYRKDSLPVSMMWQWCVSRSRSAVVILASIKTLLHSANARLVVIITLVRS